IIDPVQVAFVLRPYGPREEELIAGILHDVVEDCVETNAGAEEMRAKIREKFGAEVAAIVDGVTETKRDSDDRQLDRVLKRGMYLIGLAKAPVGSLWVCAA